MPQFVMKLVHPPDQCPIANSKIRQLMVTGAAEMPTLAQKLGIKFVAGPFTLGSEHEGLAIVEAANAEAVNDFAMQGGLVQWNSIRVILAIPLEESMKDLDKIAPIY